ncbi:MAG: hypothetical protein QXH70_00830 [Thermofilaceae archaeon]
MHRLGLTLSSPCGGMLFALLGGCTEELKVSLSSIAEALVAFMLTGLVPGGIALTQAGEGRTALVQQRRTS